MTKKNKSAIQRRLIPTYIFLIIWSFISVFPFYWMIVGSTNTAYDVSQGKLTFGSAAVENFTNLVNNYDVLGALGNSFKYSAIQTVLCLFICSLAGFGFELYHDDKKDKLFAVLLLAMMVPQVATMVPLFSMIAKMKMLNTVFAFVLPAISTPFMIMLFRQNSRNFPPEIMEAARLDGLSEWKIFFRMYMPVMKSTYAAAAVISFMGAWNSYLWPRIVMPRQDSQTMPLFIAVIAGGYTIDYGKLMMGVLFCSLPTMIIFFVLQKQFAEGITGSVK